MVRGGAVCTIVVPSYFIKTHWLLLGRLRVTKNTSLVREDFALSWVEKHFQGKPL